MATIGNTTKPTSAMAMTGLNNQNQVALKVTMPSDGEITHVGVWCAGNGSAATMKVCVWSSTGNLRRASDSFNAPGQSLAQGNTAKEEHALTSPLAVSDGDVLYIGFSSDPTEARQWGVNGSGTHWRDTSTSQGADASFVSSSGSIGAYAIYTTNKPPNKPAIQSPKNNVVLIGTDLSPQLNATFSDPDGGNIQNYDLQVDNGSGFTAPLKWDIGPTTTGLSGNTLARGYNGEALVRGGHYYWRVRARDPDNALSVWSDTAEFNINDLPVATKVSPLAGGLAFIHNLATDLSVWAQGVAHAKPQLKWTYSDTDGQAQAKYQVRIYEGAAFGGALVHDSGIVNGAVTTYDAPWAGLYDHEYQWSVVVFDGLEWNAEVKTTFKMLWAQGIYETPALPVPSTNWAFSSVKAGNGQAALLFATATGATGAGRSAWSTNIGALSPAVRLNVMVRLAHQTGTVPSLTSMTFTYMAGVGVPPDNWLLTPSADFVLGSDVVRFGSQALKCTVATTADHRVKPFRVVDTDHMPVKGATTYVFSAYVKTDEFRPHLTGSNKIVLEVYQAGSSVLIPAHEIQPVTDFETQDTSGKGDRNWQRLHYIFTTEADTTEVDVFVTYRNIAASANGDIWYVDGAQLESGNVVTAWSPGQIAASGAVVTDAAGVQINALEGGILRLKAGAGDRDLVELGSHGLLLGGDTELVSDTAGQLSVWDGTRYVPINAADLLTSAPLWDNSVGFGSSTTLAASGGVCIQPVRLPGPILLSRIQFWSSDATLVHNLTVGLYRARASGGSVLDLISGTQVVLGYTASAAAVRAFVLSPEVMIPPGNVFVVMRNNGANTTNIGRTGASSGTGSVVGLSSMTISGGAALGSTLDIGSWTGGNAILGFVLVGNVAGRVWI